MPAGAVLRVLGLLGCLGERVSLPPVAHYLLSMGGSRNGCGARCSRNGCQGNGVVPEMEDEGWRKGGGVGGMAERWAEPLCGPLSEKMP